MVKKKATEYWNCIQLQMNWEIARKKIGEKHVHGWEKGKEEGEIVRGREGNLIMAREEALVGNCVGKGEDDNNGATLPAAR